jgi:flavodoxin
MKRILAAYSSNAGYTAEVAEAIRRGLEGPKAALNVRRIEEVLDLGRWAAGGCPRPQRAQPFSAPRP